MKIIIVNGPNLNLLGTREPDIYGNNSFDGYLEKLKSAYPTIEFDYFQSNIEGELVDKIQQTGFTATAIILNAAAYTHTSIALYDAIKAITTPVIEVHLSNVHAREEYRHHSAIAAACKGVIAGFGLDSYRLAIESVLQVNK